MLDIRFTPSSRQKRIILACLVIAATLLVFLPSLKNNFIYYDDNAYITENEAIHSPVPANLKNISTRFFAGHYHPLTMFSYMLEYQFYQLDPFGYHLDNLLLHLFNCLLVFWFIYRLSSSAAAAFLVSLLFGIHPLQVETVAWISERKNLLYACFYLCALVSYLYYLKRNKPRYIYLCLFFFLLSLLSKSMAVTLPLALLLLDYQSGRKNNPGMFIEKAPFFFLSLLFGALAFCAARSPLLYFAASGFGPFTKLTVICSDITGYLLKIFLVSWQYPYAAKISSDPYYLICFIAVLALLILVILSRGITRKIIFGSGLFLLMIFPAVRFLPAPSLMAADRYMYLPCLGIFYLLAQGYLWLFRRRYFLAGVVLALILSASVIFLGQTSRNKIGIWNNDLTLWNDFTNKYPTLPLGYLGRGLVFLNEDNYFAAQENFQEAIKLGTLSPSKENDLRHYKTISLFATINLSRAYSGLGKDEEAINALNEAIRINPKIEMLYTVLASLYLQVNDFDNAEDVCKKGIENFPLSVKIHADLAFIYAEKNDYRRLKELYNEAVRHNLPFFPAYFYLAGLKLEQGNNAEAILLYRKALRINRDSKEACLGLGNAYLTLGKNQSAIHYLKKALEIDPQMAAAHNSLALACYYAGKYDLAVRHYEESIKLGYPPNARMEELFKRFRR